ncbi:hypothetical protein D3C85_1671470 [compost metagenome]
MQADARLIIMYVRFTINLELSPEFKRLNGLSKADIIRNSSDRSNAAYLHAANDLGAGGWSEAQDIGDSRGGRGCSCH